MTTDLQALADRELVVGAILASNTSSIPIMKLGVATERPESVIGIHFLIPVPVLPLVELVPSLFTSIETTERARAEPRTLSQPVAQAMCRQPSEVLPDQTLGIEWCSHCSSI